MIYFIYCYDCGDLFILDICMYLSGFHIAGGLGRLSMNEMRLSEIAF